MSEENKLGRRKFFRMAAIGGIGASIMSPLILKSAQAQDKNEKPKKPVTNIEDVKKYPKNANSMPGKFPAKVCKINHPESIIDNQPQEKAAYEMLAKGMLELTGAKSLKEAWLQFVSPNEVIGLKVNPVAGKPLTTSHAVTQSIVKQLIEAGIPKKNILIWDRREMQLHETGYTSENYPGIKIVGTEQQDADGGFYDKEGKLYGESMIDKDWFYYADIEGEYDAYTIPYMVNGGKYSYFSRICTQMVDKIINVPILKNAGPTVTLCLKNLGYGAITNTGRLHKQLWSDTSAEVCAFPPIRDKVVLNIVDGIKGCYEGGPGANPQFICNYNTMLIGSDPVAVDRIGYDVVIKKRIEEGVQEEESSRGKVFMEMANELGLGESNLDKIELKEFDIS
jgi:Domain of unknown function (DUF362)